MIDKRLQILRAAIQLVETNNNKIEIHTEDKLTY